MVKAIIFDCFGVLIGTGFWNIYESLGGDLSTDREFINTRLEKADLGKISGEAFSHAMSEKLGISIAAYKEAFQLDEMPNEKLFAYIQNELAPNYKLALVSNATGNSVRRKIPPEKLALFEVILISDEVGLLKPNPKLFNLALQKLGTAANETVFVDDHQAYVDGAKSIGLKAILFASFENFKVQIAACLSA